MTKTPHQELRRSPRFVPPASTTDETSARGDERREDTILPQDKDDLDPNKEGPVEPTVELEATEQRQDELSNEKLLLSAKSQASSQSSSADEDQQGNIAGANGVQVSTPCSSVKREKIEDGRRDTHSEAGDDDDDQQLHSSITEHSINENADYGSVHNPGTYDGGITANEPRATQSPRSAVPSISINAVNVIHDNPNANVYASSQQRPRGAVANSPEDINGNLNANLYPLGLQQPGNGTIYPLQDVDSHLNADVYSLGQQQPGNAATNPPEDINGNLNANSHSLGRQQPGNGTVYPLRDVDSHLNANVYPLAQQQPHNAATNPPEGINGNLNANVYSLDRQQPGNGTVYPLRDVDNYRNATVYSLGQRPRNAVTNPPKDINGNLNANSHSLGRRQPGNGTVYPLRDVDSHLNANVYPLGQQQPRNAATNPPEGINGNLNANVYSLGRQQPGNCTACPATKGLSSTANLGANSQATIQPWSEPLAAANGFSSNANGDFDRKGRAQPWPQPLNAANGSPFIANGGFNPQSTPQSWQESLSPANGLSSNVDANFKPVGHAQPWQQPLNAANGLSSNADGDVKPEGHAQPWQQPPDAVNGLSIVANGGVNPQSNMQLWQQPLNAANGLSSNADGAFKPSRHAQPWQQSLNAADGLSSNADANFKPGSHAQPWQQPPYAANGLSIVANGGVNPQSTMQPWQQSLNAADGLSSNADANFKPGSHAQPWQQPPYAANGLSIVANGGVNPQSTMQSWQQPLNATNGLSSNADGDFKPRCHAQPWQQPPYAINGLSIVANGGVNPQSTMQPWQQPLNAANGLSSNADGAFKPSRHAQPWQQPPDAVNGLSIVANGGVNPQSTMQPWQQSPNAANGLSSNVDANSKPEGHAQPWRQPPNAANGFYVMANGGVIPQSTMQPWQQPPNAANGLSSNADGDFKPRCHAQPWQQSLNAADGLSSNADANFKPGSHAQPWQQPPYAANGLSIIANGGVNPQSTMQSWQQSLNAADGLSSNADANFKPVGHAQPWQQPLNAANGFPTMQPWQQPFNAANGLPINADGDFKLSRHAQPWQQPPNVANGFPTVANDGVNPQATMQHWQQPISAAYGISSNANGGLNPTAHLQAWQQQPYAVSGSSVSRSPLQRQTATMDYLSEVQLRDIDRRVESLIELWRKDHKPFSTEGGNPQTLSVSKLAHDWSLFCSAQWLNVVDPAAVRAFLGGALTSKLSSQIKAAYESLWVADIRTRSYHQSLFNYAMAYLRAHHSAPVSATHLLQRFLTIKQAGKPLTKFLDEIETILGEMRFVFENNQQAPVDVGYIASSLIMALDTPYKGWYYDELQKRYGEFMPSDFDGLADALRALRRRGYVLNVGDQTFKSLAGPEQKLTPVMSQVGPPPSGTENAAVPSSLPAQSAPPHPKKSRFSSCKRCYNGSHAEESCTVEMPKDMAMRCRCGSRKHPVGLCPIDPAKLKCSRCLGAEGLPEQQPHRSGVCPYSLHQIQNIHNNATNTTSTETGDTPPVGTTTAFSKSIIVVNGEVHDPNYGALINQPSPEIFTVAVPPTLTLRSVAVSQELRTTITVGYPGCAEPVTVSCLWDTGATATLIRSDVLKLLDKKNGCAVFDNIKATRGGGSQSAEAVLADNVSRISIRGSCRVVLQTSNASADSEVFVADSLGCPLIIGVPTLSALNATFTFTPDGVSITTGENNTEVPTVAATAISSSTDGSMLVGASPARRGLPSLSSGFEDINWARHDNNALPGLPPSRLSALAEEKHRLSLLPADCVLIEPTRSGRFAVDFKSDSLESLAGSGWSSAIARATRSSRRRTASELSLITTALDKLKASPYVSTMTLRSLSTPPPRRVLSKLYQNNRLIRDTHLSNGAWLDRYLPVFVPSQFVLKPSSVSTPCRVVYDCREVNKSLQKPNTTRWDLIRYLTLSCTRPVVGYADLAKAFNQVLITSRSSGTCCTVLRCPTTGSYILVVWCVMPFGAAPSPGGLELATGCIGSESCELNKCLMQRFTESTDDISPNKLPELYLHPDFAYARPVLEAAFSNSPGILSSLPASLPEDLGWCDYVDDWSWGLYHIRQLWWAKALFTSVATFRGFTYAEGKESDSWQNDSAPLLGYRLQNDRLHTTIDIAELGYGVSKRDVSKCLSSHYDPLGRHIELGMYARGVWRKVVAAINDTGVATDMSWRCRVPRDLVDEANIWLRLAKAVCPTPRFVPISSGPFCNIPCDIIITCDASGIAWAIDTRSRLHGQPLSPRLRARGGMFPAPRHLLKEDISLEATIPRKELHALVQAAAEAHYLCSTLKLDTHHGTKIYILTDNLINIQRLAWLSGKSKEQAVRFIGKKGKHQFSENDLNKLVRVRELLWRCVVPVTVLHVPSAINIADAASRCCPTPPTAAQLRLLELLLDRAHQQPRYIPPSGPDDLPHGTTDGAVLWEDDADEVAEHWIGSLRAEVRPGPMPPPFQQDDTLPVLTAEEEAGLDIELDSLIKADPFYSAISAYLKQGSASSPFSPERLRRASACYQLDERGRLYRVTLQSPAGDVIKQRVVAATGPGRKLVYRLVVTKHILWNHLGAKKLAARLSLEYFWKKMDASVRSAVSTCLPCVRSNATQRFRSSAGVRNVQSLRPFMVVGIDLYLPGLRSDNQAHRSRCSKNDVTAMLLITCAATGFIEACVIRGPVTATIVCECLEATFASSIYPSIILSDNDAKFCASAMQKWCRSKHIVHCFAPIYSPLLCLWERGHREVTRCLRACVNDSGDYGDNTNSLKDWHILVLECIDVLNGSPYGSSTWLSPRMLAFPYFSEADYYGGDPSTDEIISKMASFSTPEEARKLRDEARSSYRLKLLHYLQHWSKYREASRARVLAGMGRECDLRPKDRVYHLVSSSTSAKLASRVQGPYELESLEAERATAILLSPNGSRFRAWVGNLVKVPHNEFVDAETTAPPCPWSLEGLPPVAVLPPPRVVLSWPPGFCASTSPAPPVTTAQGCGGQSPHQPSTTTPASASATQPAPAPSAARHTPTRDPVPTTSSWPPKFACDGSSDVTPSGSSRPSRSNTTWPPRLPQQVPTFTSMTAWPPTFCSGSPAADETGGTDRPVIEEAGMSTSATEVQIPGYLPA